MKSSVVGRVEREEPRGRQCGASLSKRWPFGRRADVWRPRAANAGGGSYHGRHHGRSRRGTGGFPSLAEIGNILKRGDLALAFGVLTILVVLILPLPAIVLDLFLAISITLSILILMTSLFIQTPLEFSAFPTILLISTMLRLSLNLASTRLILSHGHEGTAAAGHVIEAFGNFVMSGNFVIGIIVFAILVIVNFVVITKGSGRIAEVAARFHLDAMPGKQMAIDADLGAGLIDEATAKKRRKELEDESGFFGAMDGASKFVRGDAVAGLLVVFINIIGGIIIGVAQQGMGFADAARTYTMLTVGDGLVTQVPALIVSTAAGLLVSKAGVTGAADKALMKQLSGYPQALGMSAGVMIVLALAAGHSDDPVPRARRRRRRAGVEGRPAQSHDSRRRGRRSGGPGACGRRHRRRRGRADLDRAEDRRSQDRARLRAVAAGQRPRRHRPPDRADQGAAPLARHRNGLCDAGGAHPRQRPARGQHLHHQDQGGRRRHRQDLAEPVHGHGPRRQPGAACPASTPSSRPLDLPATWVDAALKEEASLKGYTVVDAATVLSTHLTELLKNNMSDLLSYGEVQKLLKDLPKEQGELVKDIVPSQVTMSGIQRVLQLLLAERISIRDLSTILEGIADALAFSRNPATMVEHVRARLARQICAQNTSYNGYLPLIALSARWEQAFAELIVGQGEERSLAMQPSKLSEFMTAVRNAFEQAAREGEAPVLVTSSAIRPFVRSLVERFRSQTTVLSQAEIHPRARLKTVGSV